MRLNDNPAIQAAHDSGNPVICLFILEDGYDEFRPLGGARKWWLDKSLKSLADDLKSKGGQLVLRRCERKKSLTVLEEVVSEADISAVFWNRRYAPQEIEKDKEIKTALTEGGISVQSFNGSLLCEPWTLKTGKGDPYKVFTPFWKALKPDYKRTHPKGCPDLKFGPKLASDKLTDWALHPTRPDWSGGISDFWSPGEKGAKDRLSDFLDNTLKGYQDDRDRPDKAGTSLLSPHLSFGEISPQAIWDITVSRMDENSDLEKDGWAFLREIAWRDFSYSLLYQSECLHTSNWNDRFNSFPWASNEPRLIAWQKGLTGYPMVDAGMRQLWHTGWMHNRVRMIVGSFLVKHLLIDWREGEDWFWDTLVDADTANNPASWQWVAGSGADAAPYFRIFNPMTQGEKFDPDGAYVRKWVPELKKLPTKYIHEPWSAPDDVLSQCGISLGRDYPNPVVDHKHARERALEAYGSTS